AKGYGMKSDVINGFDVFTVFDKMKEIAEDVRKNSQPWLLEIRTYRYRGHSMSDPADYREEGELDDYKQKDPIDRMKNYLMDENIADEDRINEIQEEVDDEVTESIDFAEESDFPDSEALYEDVYVEDDYPFHT